MDLSRFTDIEYQKRIANLIQHWMIDKKISQQKILMLIRRNGKESGLKELQHLKQDVLSRILGVDVINVSLERRTLVLSVLYTLIDMETYIKEWRVRLDELQQH